ncbi:DUF952 domain-containing protein [Nocardioides alcanivorans]|uniref:DUF952 domain-containing protein n=1 Tax=Nocardioides alcanivorans TaxID=2897352 RepID=UPI001F22A459|nr:DUF952 domain-containing protein [Nocardioides alcanivorans]
MKIYHVAEKTAWEAATTAGAYARSTRGRSLEDEGFIHAAAQAQVSGVIERFWADHPGPLVLLEIDTDKLTSPWRMEQVGDESFPHIHGALNPGAVVSVEALPTEALPSGATTPPRTFMQEYLAEFSFRLGTGIFVMVMAAIFGFGFELLVAEDSGLWGLLLGFALAVAVVVPITRRRRRNAAQQQKVNPRG